MKVYVVTEDGGEYENHYTRVVAVFSRRDLAEQHCEAKAATPGFVSECGPGNENAYDVEEWDVWDTPATTHVLTFNINELVNKTTHRPEPRRAYRVVEVMPVGSQQSLWYATLTPNEREPDWCSIAVRQPTTERAFAEYRRLRDGWH